MNFTSSCKNGENAATKRVKTRTDTVFTTLNNVHDNIQTYYFIDLGGNYVAPTEVVLGQQYSLKSDFLYATLFVDHNIYHERLFLILDGPDVFPKEDIGTYAVLPPPYDYEEVATYGPDISPYFTLSEKDMIMTFCGTVLDPVTNIETIYHYYQITITTTRV